MNWWNQWYGGGIKIKGDKVVQLTIGSKNSSSSQQFLEQPVVVGLVFVHP